MHVLFVPSYFIHRNDEQSVVIYSPGTLVFGHRRGTYVHAKKFPCISSHPSILFPPHLFVLVNRILPYHYLTLCPSLSRPIPSLPFHFNLIISLIPPLLFLIFQLFFYLSFSPSYPPLLNYYLLFHSAHFTYLQIIFAAQDIQVHAHWQTSHACTHTDTHTNTQTNIIIHRTIPELHQILWVTG